MNEPLYKYLESISCKVAEELVRMYHGKTLSGLIFPSRRKDKQHRVSEQEARILFCNMLEKPFCHSIETPTKLRYSGFSQKAPKVHLNDKHPSRSGSIDLTIYDSEHMPICNVEFKFGQPDSMDIAKDILKLYSEIPYPMWFHILEHSNSATLQSFIRKLNDAVKYTNKFISSERIELKGKLRKELYIFVVILENDKKQCRKFSMRYKNCLDNKLEVIKDNEDEIIKESAR